MIEPGQWGPVRIDPLFDEELARKPAYYDDDAASFCEGGHHCEGDAEEFWKKGLCCMDSAVECPLAGFRMDPDMEDPPEDAECVWLDWCAIVYAGDDLAGYYLVPYDMLRPLDDSELEAVPAPWPPSRDPERGWFYAIQLLPEHAPSRIKLGFSRDVRQRLRSYRTANPDAQLVGCWPCESALEPAAIHHVVGAVSCTQRGQEVVDVKVEELPRMLRCLTEFFARRIGVQS